VIRRDGINCFFVRRKRFIQLPGIPDSVDYEHAIIIAFVAERLDAPLTQMIIQNMRVYNSLGNAPLLVVVHNLYAPMRSPGIKDYGKDALVFRFSSTGKNLQ
jgi:hypothetical protein